MRTSHPLYFNPMKRYIVLLCVVVPLMSMASKYTQAMYEKAVEPVNSDSVQLQQEDPAPDTSGYKGTSGEAITHKFLIVVGSFKESLNASNMVEQIKQRGEGNPYAVVSPEGLYRVVYQSSNNEMELRELLASIKKDYPSAWILKIGD